MSDDRIEAAALLPGDVVLDDAGGRHTVSRVSRADLHTWLTLEDGRRIRVPARLRLRRA
jgi:hypothetical protein